MDARDRVWKLIEDGFVTTEHMVVCCLKFMSVEDVARMLDANGLSERFLDADEDAAE